MPERRLRRRIVLRIMLCTIGWHALGFAVEEARPFGFRTQQPKRGSIRVLLIGNSMTYFHNTPVMLEEMARSAGLNVKTQLLAEPGASLEDLWKSGAAEDVLAQARWDYVILQPQSTLGFTFLINGVGVTADARLFHQYAGLWIKRIRESGAEPILFLNWAKRDLGSAEQSRLNYFFAQLSARHRVVIAPVGMVWSRLRRELPEMELFSDDGLHPSPAGSYVAAATLLGTFANIDPVGLPTSIIGPVLEEESGQPVGTQTTLVALDRGLARRAQEEIHASQGFLNSSELVIEDPGGPELPQKPPGRRPTANDLKGTWLGEIATYPKGVGWPGKIQFELGEDAEGVRAVSDLVLTFDKGTLQHPIDRLQVSEEGIAFIDPQGPDGGIVRYSLSFTGSGLVGVAEFIVSDKPIYGIGIVHLNRRTAP